MSLMRQIREFRVEKGARGDVVVRSERLYFQIS